MRINDPTPTSFHLYCGADALDCDLAIVSRNPNPLIVEFKKSVNDNLIYIINECKKKVLFEKIDNSNLLYLYCS